MPLNPVLFTSNSQQWQTRWEYFNVWNERFGFTLDVCASHGAQKCDNYYAPEVDGLTQPWTDHIFWCNPPYAKGEQEKWVARALEQKATGVFLLPARTDTKLFHELILPNCSVEFIKGRLVFGSDEYWESVWSQLRIDLVDEKREVQRKRIKSRIGRRLPAPFPSMLVKTGDLR